MDQLRASSKTISLRNWRRPSARAGALPDPVSRPKTSRYRTEGTRPINPLVLDANGEAEISPSLPSMPDESCIILKYLVDFLLKNKLHKRDLFLLEAKPSEKTKLLQYIHDGELPDRLSQYSSRSVSHVVLDLIADTYAPLLPHDCYVELVQQMRQRESVKNQVAVVARAIQSHLSPERRTFVESLLNLLYRLSRKATATMNPNALGSLVAIKLVARATDRDNADELRSVGEFLVENANEILRQRQDLSRWHAETVDADRQRDRSHQQLDRTHTFTHATKIISRNDQGRGGKFRLDEDVAARINAVLSAIIASSQSKHGVFTALVPSRDSLVFKYLRGTKHTVDFSSMDVRELAGGVRHFLEYDVEPLLGMFNSTTSGSMPTVEGYDNEGTLVRNLQVLVANGLPRFAQDTLVLLLAAIRLALDAGTDPENLVAAFTPWMFASADDDTVSSSTCSSWCRTLLLNMSIVLQPIMARRAREGFVRQMIVAFRVAMWVTKCRLKAIESRRRKDDALWLWTEATAVALCDVVEMLLAQTRAYPSRFRRLYLDGGDEVEVSIIVEKLCNEEDGINAELFSPHSVALAVRRVLTAMLRPLSAEPEYEVHQSRLKQLLLAHREELVRHETFDHIRLDLEDAFDEMLFHHVSAHDVITAEENSLHDEEPQADVEPVAAVPHGEVDDPLDVSRLDEEKVQAVGTLSMWLANIGNAVPRTLQEKPQSTVLPPPGFTQPMLQALQGRIGDIRFVLKHILAEVDGAGTNQSKIAVETEAQTRLVAVLEWLQIPPILISRHRATTTLMRIHNANLETKISVRRSQLDDLEIVEALVLETLGTLQQPAMVPLYPTSLDQLEVLLDVWGLGDRSVVIILAENLR